MKLIIIFIIILITTVIIFYIIITINFIIIRLLIIFNICERDTMQNLVPYFLDHSGKEAPYDDKLEGTFILGILIGYMELPTHLLSLV